MIHPVLLTAVQLHPLGAVTATEPEPPVAVNVREPGAIVSVHGAPAWPALNVFPAIVTDPVREALLGFAAALNVTVPLPDPLAPAVTVIHDALLVADQAQPAGAVTLTFVDSPVVANEIEPGAMVSVQLMPAWVAPNVLPAIVTLPFGMRCLYSRPHSR